MSAPSAIEPTITVRILRVALVALLGWGIVVLLRCVVGVVASALHLRLDNGLGVAAGTGGLLHIALCIANPVAVGVIATRSALPTWATWSSILISMAFSAALLVIGLATYSV